MTKQNKTEKQLWPYIVISFAIVFVMAVVIQHWTTTEPETEYSNDTIQSNSIEDIVDNYQEVDDLVVVEQVNEVEITETEIEESFNEAFARARVELGIGGSFVWDGKKYSTFLAGEANQQVKELIPIPDENELEPVFDTAEEEIDTSDDVIVSNIADNQDVTLVTE